MNVMDKYRFQMKEAVILFLLCSFISFHASSQYCNCFQFTNLQVNKNFQILNGYPIRIDAIGVNNADVDGGRFFIASNGNVGIGNPNPQKDPGTGYIWPVPQARLHNLGTGILGGVTLVGNDPTALKNWLALSDHSKSVWGLWVDKGVVATDYAITTPAAWADFVFDSGYVLRPLKEVALFINRNRHLPDIPSADQIKKDGYTLQDMNRRFLEKIEELTLYTINQDKQIQALQQRLDELESKLAEIQFKQQ
jgi:hypothetical protein